jgi:hypothetical protein
MSLSHEFMFKCEGVSYLASGRALGCGLQAKTVSQIDEKAQTKQQAEAYAAFGNSECGCC